MMWSKSFKNDVISTNFKNEKWKTKNEKEREEERETKKKMKKVGKRREIFDKKVKILKFMTKSSNDKFMMSKNRKEKENTNYKLKILNISFYFFSFQFSFFRTLPLFLSAIAVSFEHTQFFFSPSTESNLFFDKFHFRFK